MYRPVPLCDISQVVRTGTYDSIVQVGTGRYVPVRTDMYQVYRIPDDHFVGAKNDKEICADHEYLQPLIILIHTLTYSYIRVYTCTYSYILVHTTKQHYVLRIRLDSPCNDVLSLLHACAAHCSQHPSFPSQAGLATPKLPQPRVDLIDIAAPLSVRSAASAQPYGKPVSLRLLNM